MLSITRTTGPIINAVLNSVQVQVETSLPANKTGSQKHTASGKEIRQPATAVMCVLTALNTAKTVALALLLTVPITTVAAQTYKYQDEHGRWHFSDKRPDASTLSNGKKGTARQKKDRHIAVINRGSKQQPDFEVINGLAVPVQIIFNSSELLNMQATPRLPVRTVVPALGTKKLTSLRRIDPTQAFSYNYSIRYVIGDPSARHLSGKPYALPFPVSKEFVISQAQDAVTDHKHSQTKYAVDIPMPAGTLIHATRTGTVIDIRGLRLAPGKNNKRVYQMRILHNDGTIGIYGYLEPGSSKVKAGDKVLRSQPIAELETTQKTSGKTHLHFAVLKNTGMKHESIPFEFINFDGSSITPKSGLRLKHPP